MKRRPTGLGLQLTYELLAEAKWGDGTPITTEDKIFTWQVGRHEHSGVSDLERFAGSQASTFTAIRNLRCT